MSMNPFLADMYGTRETIGAGSSAQDQDVEKLAEAQLLDQALAAEGVDVDKLDAGTILKVAYSLFGEDSALIKAAQEGEEKKEPEEGETEEHEESEHPAEEAAEEKKPEESAEEKVAQADFLGRVMAHSFVQETDNITKEAGRAEIAAKAGEYGTKALEALKNLSPGSISRGVSGEAKGMREAFRVGKSVSNLGGHGKVRQTLAGLGHMAKKHKAGTTVAGLAALGVPTAAAVGVKKAVGGKKKAASALDMFAEQRALEILKEAGVNVAPEQTEEEKLAAAIEQRAWEMLSENGFLNE